MTLGNQAVPDPLSYVLVNEPATGYADAETRQKVEAYSVAEALKILRTKYPDERVKEMPHNNPGYDVQVGPAEHPVLHVEVKGTLRAEPHFFLSEGERVFALHHPARYLLLVIYAIKLKTKEHSVARWSGSPPLEGSPEVMQWRGRLGLPGELEAPRSS